jgi:hypothetical protein
VTWHLSTKAATVDSLESELEMATPETNLDKDADQVQAAKDLALLAVQSGHFGSGPFAITLSGRAKRGNSDTSGSSLSISIHSRV